MRLRALIPGVAALVVTGAPAQLTRVQVQQPEATCDLGVGLWAWPLPMDYDLRLNTQKRN